MGCLFFQVLFFLVLTLSYNISVLSIASALSKSKPKTTTSAAATTGSSGSTSNQNNTNSNSSSGKNNTSKNTSNYKQDPRYSKISADSRKKVDKVMKKFPNLTYDELAYPWDLVGLDIVVEWANDGDSWENLVAMAERASGDYILE